MRTVHFCTVAMLSIVSSVVHADDRATAEQLLTAYEKTEARLKSFHIECVTKEWDGEMPQGDAEKDTLVASRVQKTTIFHHDFRWRIALVDQLTPKSVATPTAPRLSGIEYRYDNFLGAKQGLHVQWASNDANEPPVLDFVGVRLFGAPAGDGHDRYLNSFDFVLGRTPCDAREYLWTLMSEATAYAVTKAFWSQRPALANKNSAWSAILPSKLGSLGVRLHPGALRYYLDAGVPVPASLR